MSNVGFIAQAYHSSGKNKSDFNKWKIMMNESLSKNHMRDDYCKKKNFIFIEKICQ